MLKMLEALVACVLVAYKKNLQAFAGGSCCWREVLGAMIVLRLRRGQAPEYIRELALIATL